MALHNTSSQQWSRDMLVWPLPPEIVLWVAQLATPLHARHAWRLLPLLRGLLFAKGRRTVAAWLRAAGLGPDYKRYYYFLGALGHQTRFVASLLLRRVADVVAPGERILLGLDDTPTKRYGPQAQEKPAKESDHHDKQRKPRLLDYSTLAGACHGAKVQ
jgi:hypothetical protein